MFKGDSSHTKRKKRRMNDTSEEKKKKQEASNKVDCNFIIVGNELKIRRK